MSPFVFYMILRSATRIDFPLRGLEAFPSFHGMGAPLSGHTGFLGANLDAVYQPAKGREFRVLDHGIPFSVDLIDDEHLRPQILPQGSCYVAQVTPYSSHTFVTVNRGLYVFGLYNGTSELLVVTDVADFDDQIALHHPGEYFLYRFHAFESGRLHLNTKRLITRWSRWATSPKSSLKTPSERFYVLDQSLFHC